MSKEKENAILLWFDPKIDSRYDAQDARNQLNDLINEISFYNEAKSCISFIQSHGNKRIFLVTSGQYASDLLSSVGNLPQIDRIFLFCLRKARYEYLPIQYPKIVGIFILLDELCASIKEQIDLAVQNHIQAFSFFDPKENLSEYFSKELAEFLCFQLLNYAIRRQPQNEQSRKQMIKSCREYCGDEPPERTIIDLFEKNYEWEDAIRWYSKQSFIYKMINNALRKRDINQLYPLRHFIADLSRCLAREHNKILLTNQTLILYRGFKLTKNEYQTFKKNEGKLASSNGFISTSRSRSSALFFAKKSTLRTDTTVALIEIRCDPKELGKSVIFADISAFSEFPNESEVLFDFRICF